MASADKDLIEFVGRALDRGESREAIERALTAAGWPPGEARSALAAYAAVDFPMAVPRPRPSVSARDAFLYLLLFLTLSLSAFYLGALLFELVDRLIPDPDLGEYRGYSDDWIRWCVAMLAVSVPVFGLVARRIGREVAADPAKRASSVRKWLTYIALFIAAMVLIGDVVALIYEFLRGELTLRFCLKIVIVAAIAGPIFLFYYRTVSDDAQQS